jgi:hypothetical protein
MMMETSNWTRPIYGPTFPDYRTFRSVGLKLSGVAVAIRMISFFGMAITGHSHVAIRYFLDMLPYPVVYIDGKGFAYLVSHSTLYAAIGSFAVFALVALKRNARDQVTVGCFMAVLSSAEMLLVDVVRHFFRPPVTVYSTALWTLWPLGLSALVMFLVRQKKPAVNAFSTALNGVSDRTEDDGNDPFRAAEKEAS